MNKRLAALAALTATVCMAAGLAHAAGQPLPWQTGFQEAASPVMERLNDFHNMLLVIITCITVFVLVLLLIIFVRFNAKANPTPSKTAHNTMLEVAWTIVPIIILMVIVVPSFRLLYFEDKVQNADMTVKIIGHQWYWTYEYPDSGDLEFDAYMIADDELQQGQPRLLATDESVVLPVDTNIRLLVTADDVIHSWAIPAFGVKMDAVPGRMNETWVRITHEGMFYGQCSELCGVDHAFMPIQIKAVSKAAFAEWVSAAQEKFARVNQKSNQPAIKIASASASSASAE